MKKKTKSKKLQVLFIQDMRKKNQKVTVAGNIYLLNILVIFQHQIFEFYLTSTAMIIYNNTKLYNIHNQNVWKAGLLCNNYYYVIHSEYLLLLVSERLK